MPEERASDTPTYAAAEPPAAQNQQVAQVAAPSTTTEYRAPGWYPDPLQERLWDGEEWTERVRPIAIEQSTAKSHPQSDKPKMRAGGQAAKQGGLPTKVLLEGLDYGPNFQSGSSCYNCGQLFKVAVDSCTTCGVKY
jgi:hypothetical protein